MDGKLTKSIGMVLGIFLVIIILLVGVSSCSGSGKKKVKKYTYEKLRDKMMEVAKAHYEENPKEMPSEDGDSKTYTLKKMINDEKIGEVTEIFNNEEMKCDGSVTLMNNNGYYVYVPYLKCSAGKDDKFETTLLSDKIKEDSLVTAGNGLYQMDDEYYYRGNVENNYVKFPNSKRLYRIVGINPDGSIKVLQLKNLTSVTWDNRYNIEYLSKDGINDYYVNEFNSNIKDSLENAYATSPGLDDTTRGYIASQTLCIGKRALDDTTKDGSTECAEKLEGQQFGALALYEIFRVSLDDNCTTIKDGACANYNWMYKLGKVTWLITASSESTRDAYVYDKKFELKRTNKATSVLPTFNIIDKALYKEGTGTEKDPYVLYIPELETTDKKKK